MDDGKDVVQLLAEIEDEEEGRELELDVVGVVVQPANKTNHCDFLSLEASKRSILLWEVPCRSIARTK